MEFGSITNRVCKAAGEFKAAFGVAKSACSWGNCKGLLEKADKLDKFGRLFQSSLGCIQDLKETSAVKKLNNFLDQQASTASITAVAFFAKINHVFKLVHAWEERGEEGLFNTGLNLGIATCRSLTDANNVLKTFKSDVRFSSTKITDYASISATYASIVMPVLRLLRSISAYWENRKGDSDICTFVLYD